MTFFSSLEQLYSNNSNRVLVIGVVCLFVLALLIVGIIILVRRRR